ncbi:hypothetical protein F0562_022479 [Nyssa sinensis]|uniref:Uncharacterized protein n=1 Tax=Nyssa sinensis TaxID=561372 RepID=A0A5J5BTA4_9ASTE|nr:hypothetical protein F0562_022479 [Nyssa sinensis]
MRRNEKEREEIHQGSTKPSFNFDSLVFPLPPAFQLKTSGDSIFICNHNGEHANFLFLFILQIFFESQIRSISARFGGEGVLNGDSDNGFPWEWPTAPFTTIDKAKLMV